MFQQASTHSFARTLNTSSPARKYFTSLAAAGLSNFLRQHSAIQANSNRKTRVVQAVYSTLAVTTSSTCGQGRSGIRSRTSRRAMRHFVGKWYRYEPPFAYLLRNSSYRSGARIEVHS